MRRKSFLGSILTLVHGSWAGFLVPRGAVCMTIGLCGSMIDALKWRDFASGYVRFSMSQGVRILL